MSHAVVLRVFLSVAYFVPSFGDDRRRERDPNLTFCHASRYLYYPLSRFRVKTS